MGSQAARQEKTRHKGKNHHLLSSADGLCCQAMDHAEFTGRQVCHSTHCHENLECMDKNDERGLFAGAMIKLADELGVEAPCTRAVSTLLEKRKPMRQER